VTTILYKFSIVINQAVVFEIFERWCSESTATYKNMFLVWLIWFH